MKILRLVAVTIAIISAFIARITFQKYEVSLMSKTKYLKLTEPLVVAATRQADYKCFHILPTGTAMYLDYQFPEGFERYRVYVNIKGEFAHEIIESSHANLIDPLWAYTVTKDEVRQLMAETPISKDDLVRILKARKITREKLAQIVREWKD